MIYRDIEQKVRDHEKRFQSNKSLIIGGSQFVANQYTWNHTMNNDDLIVNFIDSDTNEPLVPDYKILDKNNILIRNSVEHPNIKVVLSASYDKGATVVGASVEDFAGDSIGVGAKQVRIKDNSGVVKNPITDSDAVYMADGTTKLTKKISDIGASLEQKAQRVDLVVERERINNLAKLSVGSTTGDAELIDGRVGTDGKTYSNIGENIRNIAKGHGIGDKSLGIDKVNFIENDNSINLFDGCFKVGRVTGSPNFSFTPTTDATKQVIVLKIEPNTTYSIIKETSDIFKYATDSKELNLNSTYVLDGINREANSFTNLTFTSLATDKYLYIYVSTTGQSPFVQVVKGTQTSFTTNSYAYTLKGDKEKFENLNKLIDKNLLSTYLISFNYEKELETFFIDNTLKTNDKIVILRNMNKNIKTYLLPKINLKLENFGVIYLDTKELETLQTRDVPLEMIHNNVYYSIEGGYDNERYIPLFWYSNNKIHNSLGLDIITKDNLKDRKIKVIKTTDNISINIPSTKNENYLQYNYKKIIDTRINFEQWRVKETQMVDSELNTLLVLGENCEWEGAILEDGQEDFIGGYHGDETNKEISLIIDGIEYDINSTFTIKCDIIRIVNKSELNKCNDKTTPTFTRYKISEWNKENYIIKNKYIALRNIVISSSKVVMMSIDKTYSGKEIISKGRYDYDYLITDLTKAFSGIGCGKSRKDVKHMELWGKGLYASIKCNYNSEKYPNRKQTVEDFSQYNRAKCYFDLTGSYTMSKDEILESESVIQILC